MPDRGAASYEALFVISISILTLETLSRPLSLLILLSSGSGANRALAHCVASLDTAC